LADEIGVNNSTDYYDEGHLNIYGAKRITMYLGDFLESYIKSNDLSIHDLRQIEDNPWSQAME